MSYSSRGPGARRGAVWRPLHGRRGEGRGGRRRATLPPRGPKPQTREAALIMLADGVEASVRSLGSRDEPAIRAMVADHRRARSRRPVRRVRPHVRDLEKIKDAFVAQLLGMYHTRIAIHRTRSSSSSRDVHSRRRRRPTPRRDAVHLSTAWRIDVDVREASAYPFRCPRWRPRSRPCWTGAHPARRRSG